MILPSLLVVFVPMTLLMWALDAYLFAITLYGVLVVVRAQSPTVARLRILIEKVPIRVHAWLNAHFQPFPEWCAWWVVLSVTWFAREMLTLCLHSLSG